MNAGAGPGSLRLFLALTLPESVRESIHQVQLTLSRDSGVEGWRWVTPANLHLTLLFFGSVESGLANSLGDTLAGVCARHPRLRLTVNGLGAFPDFRRPRVLWVGVGGDLAPAGELYADLAGQLAPFMERPPENRFTPHITLARSRDRVRVSLPRDVAAKFSEVALGEWLADSVVLMKSQLGAGVPVYAELRRTELRPN